MGFFQSFKKNIQYVIVDVSKKSYICRLADFTVMAGLYVHIPFCHRKCIYCAFYSVAPYGSIKDDAVECLLRELKERENELNEDCHTLYIGGGTPSLLSARQWRKLTGGIKKILGSRLSPSEFTIEVNPDDVSEEMADEWCDSGVNRFSMGVQSLDDDVLKLLGRRHNAMQAMVAAEILRGRGRLSLDLIYGLPGQNLEVWERDVRGIIDLSPGHISAYSLTFEEATILASMQRRGEASEVEEGIALDMYSLLRRLTSVAGFEHYEISSFARFGERSVHNSAYWKSVPYLGIGPSASSFDGKNRRRTNPGNIRTYLQFWDNNPHTGHFFEEEVLNKEELFEELVMTRLRTSEGISLAEIEQILGKEFADRLYKRSGKHVSSGMLRISQNNGSAGNIILTDDGEFIADTVILDLIS